jgi:hypothetical protein
MGESIITNNVLYKFTTKDDRVYYTHVLCVTFPYPDWESALLDSYKQFQFVLISDVPPDEHCAVCDAIIGPPSCSSCLTFPRQPESTLCSTCQQERDDELQDHYDSHYH